MAVRLLLIPDIQAVATIQSLEILKLFINLLQNQNICAIIRV